MDPDILSQKNSGLIVLAENPSTDTVASALALYQGLIKLGKDVSLICSSKVQSKLDGTDKIKSSLSTSGNNLVISFPYVEGSIDKVDYSISQDKFNLIVLPKEGFTKINSEDVEYSYSGGSIDFIFTIDAPNLKSLGKVYLENKNQFDGKTIINIDRHLTNAFFGTVNLVAKNTSSTSELILKILKDLNVQIDEDIATALYAGLSSATNNFSSYSVGPQTFETAAFLLKSGAKKAAPKRPAQEQSRPGRFERHQEKTLESVEREPQVTPDEETPEDWLKPKIFKGGGDLL
jgi:nanoRNase/pAp phosphatase (c-di-AMP/oligoRNAs hydrolase)